MMNKFSTLKRRLLVLVFMLATCAVLATPSDTVCAFGFCEGCDNQCYQEGVTIYYQCRTNGGTVPECQAQEVQYYNNCADIFCPGCAKNHHQ